MSDLQSACQDFGTQRSGTGQKEGLFGFATQEATMSHGY